MWTQTPPVRTAASDHITFFAAANVAITNIGAALAELFGASNRRIPADLSSWTEARLAVGGGVVGNAGSEARIQYATDGGTVWAYLDGSAGPACSLAGIVTGNTSGTWVRITAAAKTDVLLRVVTIGGDGVADPTLGHIVMELR